MAAKDESSTGLKAKDVPSREEFSDFTIVCENGQEVKCHKIMLAKASPVFCRMMRKDCTETKTNKIQLAEFDQETVESFLDYNYAEQELNRLRDVFPCNIPPPSVCFLTVEFF